MKLVAVLALVYGALADFEEGGPPGQPPTPKECDLKVTTGSCSLWGDPHVNMFNGKEHDIMGQPQVIENGKQLNGFYYVARCKDFTVEDMPFQLIGVHHAWTSESSSVAGVDYFTFELYRNPTSSYYLYFGPYFQAYASSTDAGVSFDYDKTLAANPGALTELKAGEDTTIGGLGRYVATYHQHNNDFSQNGSPKADITLKIDGEFEVFIEATAQQIWKTNVNPARKRMVVATITIDEVYRCAACGLCGTFKEKGYKFELCNGEFKTIADGFNANAQPFAFWKDGVSWEVNHHNNNCAHEEGVPDVSPNDCSGQEMEAIEYACEQAADTHSTCCESLPNNLCDQLENTCAEDICVGMQQDNSFNYGQAQFESKLADAVQEFFVLELENQCEANSQGHLEPCGKGEHGAGDADLYLFCDDQGRVVVNGVQVATYANWGSEQKIPLVGNTADTVVEIYCQNNGGPGGLIATVECEQNPKEKYSTSKNGDIPPVANAGNNIVQTSRTGSPWNRNENQMQNQAKNAKWIWDGSTNKKEIKFEFSFSGKCGLGSASAIQPQPVVEDQPFDDEPEQFYEPEEYNFPVDVAPVSSGNYVLELTKTDLVILMLVLANLTVLGITTYTCLSKKQKTKYSAVKQVYDTTDDEADILVE